MKVVICGSVKANEELIQKVANYYKNYFHDEVTTVTDVPFHHTKDSEEKAQNQSFYFKKIDEADKLVVVNKDHIGIATSIEIGYAVAKEKYIDLWNYPGIFETEIQIELKALMINGLAHYSYGDYII